jgi:hypothetical protein
MADKPKKVKVTIHSGEDAGDKGDVFLAHNFRSVLIQRDQEVELEDCFHEVLKNTMIETTVKNKDGEEVPVRIPRFAFSVSA